MLTKSRAIYLSKAERKRRNYMRVVIAQALLLTIAVHMTLWLLFSYKSSTNNVMEQKKMLTIRLFNLSVHEISEQKSLINWLDIHNPTLISRADSPYSAVRNISTAPSFSVEPTHFSWSKPVFESQSITLPEPLIAKENFSGIFKDENIVVPLAIKPIKVEYPQFWINGNLQNFKFSDEIQTRSQKLYGAITQIELYHQGDDLRFNIVKSSGDTRLDTLVASEVVKAYSNAKNFKQITIYWQGDKGGKNDRN